MNTWWIPFNTSSEELNHWWSFQSSTPPSGPKWRDSILDHDFEWGVLWMGQRNPNHQLKTVVYPIIYRTSTILLVVQDFATCPPHFVFEAFRLPKVRKSKASRLNCICWYQLSCNMMPFRGPQLQVPSIYKAYFLGLWKGISPQHMALCGVLKFAHHAVSVLVWHLGDVSSIESHPNQSFWNLQYPPLPYIPMVRCVALCRLMSGWWFQMNILSIYIYNIYIYK